MILPQPECYEVEMNGHTTEIQCTIKLFSSMFYLNVLGFYFHPITKKIKINKIHRLLAKISLHI